MAATAARFHLDRPLRKRRRFSMTPLADVMFQLLIFFMLSADVLPYSLLTVQSGGLQGGAPDAAPADPRAGDARSTAVWTLDSAEIVAGGQRFGLDRLPDLAAAMALQGTPDLLLVVRSSVDIQTLARVLEVLESRGIDSVQIADGGL